MSNNPYKFGDEIISYAVDYPDYRTAQAVLKKGKIIEINGDLNRFITKDSYTIWVHYKQCELVNE